MLSLGLSRGFAFVEFYHLQDASRWMENNQVERSPSLESVLEIRAPNYRHYDLNNHKGLHPVGEM